jgi:hypothetical protein
LGKLLQTLKKILQTVQKLLQTLKKILQTVQKLWQTLRKNPSAQCRWPAAWWPLVEGGRDAADNGGRLEHDNHFSASVGGDKLDRAAVQHGGVGSGEGGCHMSRCRFMGRVADLRKVRISNVEIRRKSETGEGSKPETKRAPGGADVSMIRISCFEIPSDFALSTFGFEQRIDLRGR